MRSKPYRTTHCMQVANNQPPARKRDRERKYVQSDGDQACASCGAGLKIVVPLYLPPATCTRTCNGGSLKVFGVQNGKNGAAYAHQIIRAQLSVASPLDCK
jgi:hypothetical protein